MDASVDKAQAAKDQVGFEMPRLQASANPVAARLAGAMAKALSNDGSVDEKLWLFRIESLRKQLLACKQPLPGAGGQSVAGDDMTIDRICRISSCISVLGRALFHVVRGFRPAVCVELGTSIGMSASYQAAALELNGQGLVYTIEASAARSALARRNMEALGLSQRVRTMVGTFDQALGGLLEQCGPVDAAYIDGHHDEKATLAYFDRIFPCMSQGAVVVFDDIYWSDGMARAWSALMADNRIGLTVDLARAGLCVIGNGPGGKEHFQLRLR